MTPDPPSVAPADGPPTAGPVLTLPDPFGRYRVLRQLGAGGMGTVYLARDTQLDRLVALKVPRFGDDPDLARRFLREARAAAGLAHPNICPVFDYGQLDGRCYLTMAYLDGESLAAEVRRGPLPVRDAVAVARALADALAEAHRHGVVHRDLKPGNVLRNARGDPVLTDFGLARRRDPAGPAAGEVVTLEGAVFGSPGYMAPEQMSGDVAAIGPATDVYGLGALLYELLAGRPPFQGATPLDTVVAQMSGNPPEPPSQYRPGLDRRLDAICLQALAKDPAARFPTMTAFADALGAWLDETAARPAPPPARRPIGWWVGAAVAVLIVVLLLVRPWAGRPDPKGDPPAPAATPRDPAAADAVADRAWALNDRDDLDAAVRECDRALALDDRCVKALICRANAWIKKREYDRAVADLDRATGVEPGHPMPFVDRAWAFNAKGDHRRALAEADGALARQADSAEAYYQRGSAHHGLGMHPKAVDDFTRAIEHQRDYALAYRERAAAYRALGDDARAARDEAEAERIEKK